MRRARLVGTLLAVSCSVLVACGGGDEGSATPVLRVDLIEPALAAVAETLGDSTTYFEVNATPLVVNVFVAVEGASVVQYIYDGEALVGPSTPVEASGVTFVREIVDLNVDEVLDDVLRELPESEPTMFVVTGAGVSGAALRVEYRVLMRSSRGGELAVVVDANGSIIGTDAE